MIIITIVRISGEFFHDTIDIQWGTFWLQLESSTAIVTVSVTGFRALLRVRARKEREKSEQRRWRLQSYRQRMLHKVLPRIQPEESTDLDTLPSNLGATLTGSCTSIKGTETNNANAVDISSDHNLADVMVVADDSYREDRSEIERSISSVRVRRAANVMILAYKTTSLTLA